jgi:hypothetical protein
MQTVARSFGERQFGILETGHERGWRTAECIAVTADVPFGTPGATNIVRIAW